MPESAQMVTPAQRKWLPWLTAVGFFMQTLDTTILNTALPGMARPGDPVQVEFLDGRGETVTLPVRALAHEYLGVGAYLPTASLQALRGEQDAISGAWLRIAPGHRASVVAATVGVLQAMPSNRLASKRRRPSRA